MKKAIHGCSEKTETNCQAFVFCRVNYFQFKCYSIVSKLVCHFTLKMEDPVLALKARLLDEVREIRNKKPEPSEYCDRLRKVLQAAPPQLDAGLVEEIYYTIPKEPSSYLYDAVPLMEELIRGNRSLTDIFVVLLFLAHFCQRLDNCCWKFTTPLIIQFAKDCAQQLTDQFREDHVRFEYELNGHVCTVCEVAELLTLLRITIPIHHNGFVFACETNLTHRWFLQYRFRRNRWSVSGVEHALSKEARRKDDLDLLFSNGGFADARDHLSGKKFREMYVKTCMRFDYLPVRDMRNCGSGDEVQFSEEALCFLKRHGAVLQKPELKEYTLQELQAIIDETDSAREIEDIMQEVIRRNITAAELLGGRSITCDKVNHATIKIASKLGDWEDVVRTLKVKDVNHALVWPKHKKWLRYFVTPDFRTDNPFVANFLLENTIDDYDGKVHGRFYPMCKTMSASLLFEDDCVQSLATDPLVVGFWVNAKLVAKKGVPIDDAMLSECDPLTQMYFCYLVFDERPPEDIQAQILQRFFEAWEHVPNPNCVLIEIMISNIDRLCSVPICNWEKWSLHYHEFSQGLVKRWFRTAGRDNIPDIALVRMLKGFLGTLKEKVIKLTAEYIKDRASSDVRALVTDFLKSRIQVDLGNLRANSKYNLQLACELFGLEFNLEASLQQIETMFLDAIEVYHSDFEPLDKSIGKGPWNILSYLPEPNERPNGSEILLKDDDFAPTTQEVYDFLRRNIYSLKYVLEMNLACRKAIKKVLVSAPDLFNTKQISDYCLMGRGDNEFVVKRDDIVDTTLAWLLTDEQEDPDDSPGSTVPDISFADEEGVDTGGPSAEWASLLTSAIMKGDYEVVTSAPNPDRVCLLFNDDPFKAQVLGRFLAIVVTKGISVNIPITDAHMKFMLGHALTIEDVRDYDLDWYNSLVWCRDNSVDDAYLTFSITGRDGAEVNLCENGSDTPVTDSNKLSYLRSVVQYLLIDQFEPALSSLRSSFQSFMADYLPVISVNYMRRLTRPGDKLDYKILASALEGDKPVRAAVCQAIEHWNEADLRGLLFWVTGCSLVPCGGFTNQPAFRVCVCRLSDPGTYPMASTCSRELKIPACLIEHPETLEERLRFSIQQTEFTRI